MGYQRNQTKILWTFQTEKFIILYGRKIMVENIISKKEPAYKFTGKNCDIAVTLLTET